MYPRILLLHFSVFSLISKANADSCVTGKKIALCINVEESARGLKSDVVQWQSACLPHTRPWVRFPLYQECRGWGAETRNCLEGVPGVTVQVLAWRGFCQALGRLWPSCRWQMVLETRSPLCSDCYVEEHSVSWVCDFVSDDILWDQRQPGSSATLCRAGSCCFSDKQPEPPASELCVVLAPAGVSTILRELRSGSSCRNTIWV